MRLHIRAGFQQKVQDDVRPLKILHLLIRVYDGCSMGNQDSDQTIRMLTDMNIRCTRIPCIIPGVKVTS